MIFLNVATLRVSINLVIFAHIYVYNNYCMYAFEKLLTSCDATHSFRGGNIAAYKKIDVTPLTHLDVATLRHAKKY